MHVKTNVGFKEKPGDVASMEDAKGLLCNDEYHGFITSGSTVASIINSTSTWSTHKKVTHIARIRNTHLYVCYYLTIQVEPVIDTSSEGLPKTKEDMTEDEMMKIIEAGL